MENIPELQSMSASNGLQLILVSILVVAQIFEKASKLFTKKNDASKPVEYAEKTDCMRNHDKLEKWLEKVEKTVDEHLQYHLEGGKK